MREIKFRVWDEESKKMVYPEFPKYIQYDEDYTGFSNARIDYGTYEDKFEIMQFIGKLDKIGKEIYEQDYIVVTDKYNNTDEGFVSFSEKHSAFVLDWGDDSCMFLHYNEGDTIEIKGNKYEGIKKNEK